MRTRLGLALILLLTGFVHGADLAITGATVYPSPNDPPISDAVIIIHAGKIAAIGSPASVHIPSGTRRLDYRGAYVTSGFWNSHVHIITPALLNAKNASAAQLDAEMDRSFNRWGFTSVFDIASSLDNTLVLRSRVNQGSVRGPRILTTGEPVWTVQPVYIQQFLLDHHLPMPVSRSPLEAQRQVASEIDRGANGTKLFTGSVQAGSIANMPIDIARAAVGEAHRHHVPVFAHPQNSAGVNIAIEAGVDILAHTAPQALEWASVFVPRLIAAHMAVIPTLTLFDFEARKAHLSDTERETWIKTAVSQLTAFFSAGGEVLFGTDIGYTDHFDTLLEFELMSRAGMDYRAILASLTTVPARHFGFAKRNGLIAPGMDADLTVLDEDPATGVAAFSKVRATIRDGVFIFSKH
jgi:imidazolonepropionase-like amidohydrolase